ncbi:oxidoreductase domain protein [Xylanimonas cellulosilytica DSM 15894]|uniref:Oxidoreductase domain protein n=1 Tax=Xylanimonas cellulosilytica (strain DSM 15894 / JCM 12276 / CECT 5975 / KCTC 9989 / LMG 20990 / NBRC 107835 / XIL07) TaxID=446471 RepID=D1BSI0_XYLCX|nr:Gfo/Idh/MocA family oxidoreductase [Xylanimonas cellulosilytica]ACZ30672.1 oxidoreductase domain protein [Xylanimonas cellulosilytica DSM 15894]
MLNVAVVGTGNISTAHLAGYLTFPERCRVVALCDIVPERAYEKKERYGLADAEVVTFEELLARDDVDLVSNCTPPSEHARLTVALLAAGLNVVVEKPMAPSIAECDAMLAAARTSGAMLSVIAQNRFRDDLACVKEAVDSGLLGSIAHVRVDSAWFRGMPYYDLAWRGTWESEGGGPTLNHAIHHVDLLLWMLGAPRSVTAAMTNAWHDNAEVEDLSVALLQYERTIAALTASVVHHGEEQAFVVQGSAASVAQPWAVRATTTQPNGHPRPDDDADRVEQLTKIAQAHEPLRHEGHTGQLDDVLTAVASGRAPAVDGEAGRRTVEVVTAIYQAAIERRAVDLPIPPDSPWYTGEALLARAPRYFTKTGSVDEPGEGTYTYGGSPAPTF